jgi:Domain of unknown function (DUF222)/Adenylate and Guanylate cyclase catalytic domain
VPELPTGTVTFLFTDLEGSTHLWEEHPVAMHAALARHDEILRDAIAAHDGHVVKQRGDGFHAAFASASGALLAARDAQLALGYESWGETGALRVRMGVRAHLSGRGPRRRLLRQRGESGRAADERGPRRPDRRLAGNGRVGARFAPRRGGARRPWSGGGGGVGSERSGLGLASRTYVRYHGSTALPPIVPVPGGVRGGASVASVFERVRSAVAVLEEVVGELEPGTLDVTGAKKLVDLFTRGERVSVAGRAVAARRVAAATDWKRSGHRSAAHWFASATGVGVGAASREMETARQLESLPETETAFRAGELSPAQARDIATAASVAPHAERELLEKARSSSMKALRDACREAACRAQDDRAWAQRLHESRRVHIRTGLDGMYEANVRLAPDEGARFDSALQSKTDELFQAARAAGRREPRAAYMADALVALVTGTSPLAKPVETRLNVSYEAVKRGHVEPGEVCGSSASAPSPSPWRALC